MKRKVTTEDKPVSKPKLMRITLATVPNGYSLDVDGVGYMYYDTTSLIEGIIYHIGLHQKKFADDETIKALLTVAAKWTPDVQTQLERDSVAELNFRKLAGMQTRLAAQNTRIAELMDKVDELEEQLKQATPKEPEKKQSKNISKAEVGYGTLKPLAKIPPKEEQEVKKIVGRPSECSDDTYNALMTPLTIDATGMPTRVISVLKIVGGHENKTIGDVVIHTTKELMRVRGCGKFVIDEFSRWLDAHHLTMNMDVESLIAAHSLNHATT
jgi:hypothetical protein